MNAPSNYQTAIYDWIKSSKGRVLTVEAVAGSGKSTTLLEAIRVILGAGMKGRGAFLAFNKKIVLEFEEKTKRGKIDFPIRTFNSIGYSFLNGDQRWRSAQVDPDKYFWIAKDFYLKKTYSMGLDNKDADVFAAKLAGKANRIVDLVFNTLFDLQSGEADFSGLCVKYGFDPFSIFVDSRGRDREYALSAEDLGKIIALGVSNTRKLSLSEQVYLPASARGGVIQPYEWVLVDEAQDLNPARLRLVERMIGAKGRAIFVGDSYQAIYGFTGSDTRSMATIRSRFNADTLPLSICYRCPPDHIELVHAWPLQNPRKIQDEIDHNYTPSPVKRADIQANPERAHGVVEWLPSVESLFDGGKAIIEAGDLIICRKNAPLVSLFVKLIKAKVPAQLEDGQGAIERFADLADDVFGSCSNPDDGFLPCVSEWYRKKLDILEARFGLESEIYLDQEKMLSDDVSTLEALWGFHIERGNPQTSIGFRRTLRELFSEKAAGVKVARLSSVHRAKGLEADNVYWIGPLDHRVEGSDPEEIQQENNIEYVALTRSKRRLVLIGIPDPYYTLHSHRLEQGKPPTTDKDTDAARRLLVGFASKDTLEMRVRVAELVRQGAKLDLTRVDWNLLSSGKPSYAAPEPAAPTAIASTPPGPDPSASPSSIAGVLAASKERQRGLEDLLGRLRAAVERDGLGQYARWDAWVPFNVELEAHKAAWMREAVMPDEVKALWTGHPFTPETYAREVNAPLGVALRPESRPSPGRVELLIKAEREYRAEIHKQRYFSGLITLEEAADAQDEDTPKADRTQGDERRALLGHLAAIWRRLPEHPSRPWPHHIRSLPERQIKLLGELERLREASKPWSARD